jgi:hypothetical protein
MLCLPVPKAGFLELPITHSARPVKLRFFDLDFREIFRTAANPASEGVQSASRQVSPLWGLTRFGVEESALGPSEPSRKAPMAS